MCVCQGGGGGHHHHHHRQLLLLLLLQEMTTATPLFTVSQHGNPTLSPLSHCLISTSLLLTTNDSLPSVPSCSRHFPGLSSQVFVFCSSHADKVESYLRGSGWMAAAGGDDDDEDEEGDDGDEDDSGLPSTGGSGQGASGMGGGGGGGGGGRRGHPVVHCISNRTCTSAGDALRELDNDGLIRSDPFVLVSGDVIANVDLATVIKEHEAARKKDKYRIMTSIFKRAAPDARSRPLSSDLVVALDASTQQLLMYDDGASSPDADVDVEDLFGEKGEKRSRVQLRYDLLDCHIDVCSPEVMIQIADNYDYADLRRDFMRNEVRNTELGYRLFARTVDDGYAARVNCPRTYNLICRDVLRRLTYPMVPDRQFQTVAPLLGALGAGAGTGAGAAVGTASATDDDDAAAASAAAADLHPLAQPSAYSFGRRCIYKEPGLALARSCTIGEGTAIGRGSAVGGGSRVSQSVVGRRCRIGQGATVRGSYLWADVVIEDGAIVEDSILCDGVVVKAGAVVQRGSILSYGVVVGAGFTVPPFTRLTRLTQQQASRSSVITIGAPGHDADVSSQLWDPAVVGEGGAGRQWNDADDDEDGDDDDWGDDPAAGGTAAGGSFGGMGGGDGAMASDVAQWEERAAAMAAAAGDGADDKWRALKPQWHAMGATEAEAARAARWSDWSTHPVLLGGRGGPAGGAEDSAATAEERFRRAAYKMVRDRMTELPPAPIDNIGLEVTCFK